MHWIRVPEMHEFIIKNWRIVKVATTKAQRKLFFNLRSKTRLAQRRRSARGGEGPERPRASAGDGIGLSGRDIGDARTMPTNPARRRR